MTVLYSTRHGGRRRTSRRSSGRDVSTSTSCSRERLRVAPLSAWCPETRHLIDAAALARMKPTAVLVNTSRGPVVDQAALAEALRDGAIAAAALDVTDPEPIATDDPLLSLDNCLVVPHIASASRATRGRMASMAAANLIAGVRGEPLPNEVQPPAV